MTNLDRAADNPAIVTRVAEILERDWDIRGVVRGALHGDSNFYREQAITVIGMLSADARETEIQRYLRQLEQQAGPITLHPFEARHAIALAVSKVVRGG